MIASVLVRLRLSVENYSIAPRFIGAETEKGLRVLVSEGRDGVVDSGRDELDFAMIVVSCGLVPRQLIQ
jgi:hypothetical protein